jgi:hypothetical protein
MSAMGGKRTLAACIRNGGKHTKEKLNSAHHKVWIDPCHLDPAGKRGDCVEPTLLVFFVLVFAVPILGILYSGFQRWLQHKEKMGQLIADQTAERAAQYGAHVERIEARLRVVEQIVTDGGVHTAAQIEALRENPIAHSFEKSKDV